MRDAFHLAPHRTLHESRRDAPCELGNLANEVVVFCLLPRLGINMNKIDIMPEGNSLAFLGILGVHAVFKGVFLACGVNVYATVRAERIASLDRLLGRPVIEIERDKLFRHF